MLKYILIAALVLQTGCAHHAYKPQRIEIRSHTLILHATRVDMENAYELANIKDVERIFTRERGEYTGFIHFSVNELHCYTPWPEECMLHEYKHLLDKYGLDIPDDPHFNRRR